MKKVEFAFDIDDVVIDSRFEVKGVVTSLALDGEGTKVYVDFKEKSSWVMEKFLRIYDAELEKMSDKIQGIGGS